jgi:MFS family permease
MAKRKNNVFWLGLVSFINDTSSKIILPVLPLFIKSIGGTGLAVGLISGLGESTASLFKIWAGYWSDKLKKRKIFVLSGYFLSALAKLLFAFSYIWPHVLLLKVLERLGKGLRSAPRDAVLADSAKQEKRGKSFGFHRAMDSGGAVLGSLLAFFLFWSFDLEFKNIFLIAGVIAFFSLLPVIPVQEKRQNSKITSFSLELKKLSLPLKIIIGVATLYALANFSYMFFVLKAGGFFKGRLSTGIPILLYALYYLSYTVFAVPSGMLSDKFGRRKILVLGYGIFAVVVLGFVFAKSLALFLALFIGLGMNYAFVNVSERSLVSDLASKKIRGTALGVFHMATSLAALPAGLAAGFLYDINPNYPFIYAFGLTILALAAFFFFILKKKLVLNQSFK